MKIGDKVRFLNDVGGGVVKGFKGRDVALVEDEDGFEIPVLIRECVVINPANEMQARQTSAQAVIEATQEPEEKIVETKEGEQLTISLAYLANDIKSLSSSSYECYLINDSNYYLSYCYMTRGEGGWITRSVGVIEPNLKLFLDQFEKGDLNDMEQTCLQFFVYKKDKPFAKKDAIAMELRLDTVKFYKLHSFKENDYFDEPAIIYPIVEKDRPARELVISAEELKEAMYEKEQPRPRKEAIVKKEKAVGDVLEIDLHIHELLDDDRGLSNHEMLEYQMKKFHEIMVENKKNKGQKIVFIHGKGNGILKNMIQKELNSTYKGVYAQDASFREYGYGATMVTIK